MMKPFLWQVAEAFYKQYAKDIRDIAFIFPNRRAGVFFKKYLSEIASEPIIAPTILTITDLFANLGALQPADRITLLFTLYRHYIELTGKVESFDDFVSLGETILNDFDDVDKYMVDTRQLFTNIKDLKEIDQHFGSPLTDEQVAYIRRFWKNFMPTTGATSAESDSKQHFSSLWEKMYDLYNNFGADLRKQGLGYEGMIFRAVAEKYANGIEEDLPYKQIVFVGLNVLNTAEKSLMKSLRDSGIADFYWDNAAPTLEDKYNRASHFLSENVKDFPSKLVLEKETEEYEYPEINVLGVPSAVGQAKQCERILQQLLDQKIISPQIALNTAIVLPDEHLLMPTLYAIPEQINPINITMGYTLSNTTVAGLMDILADLQKHIRKSKDGYLFYHKNVTALLTNRYLQLSGQVAVNKLINDIRSHNKIFIPINELHINELSKTIFTPLERVNEACEYLLQILVALQEELNRIEPASNDDNDRKLTPIALEREFLFHYYLAVNRLNEIIRTNKIEMSVATYFKLLKKLTAGISIPFEGEPLSGLQIMGVLETRALDFENVIILSMNEGVFPVKKVAKSLIPYNLRKGFDLSTNEHQDSIYAYYFYRLIYRARRLFLLYDTRTEDMATGEVSRYVYQLKYHYRVPINRQIAGYRITPADTSEIVIPKDKYVMQQLNRYLEGGDRDLSASAINTYINCPMQFYLCHVEKYQESDDVAESIDAGIFGSIYHGVMQQIYDRFKGKSVQSAALEEIGKDDKLLTTYIEKAFAKNYLQTDTPQRLTGQNHLVGEVIRKYVKKTLEIDRTITPFVYKDSEMKLQLLYPIDNGEKVRLKGFIDRLDITKDGKMRVVDYKTGNDELRFGDMSELFDKGKNKRAKAIMQVLMYMMMLKDDKRVEPTTTLIPAIYKVQNLFKPEHFDTQILKSDIKNIITPVVFNPEIEAEFRSEFNKCLNEIFNPEIPFTQSPKKGEDKGPCEYCPMASICKQMAK